VVGNCAQDQDGLHGGTMFEDSFAYCAVNVPLPSVPLVKSVELGTLTYTANGGTGVAIAHILGVTDLGIAEDCTINFDVVYEVE
jgi:hypothetical protein